MEHKRRYDRERMRRLYYDPAAAPERAPRARILVVDIETRPALAYVWTAREQWIPPERIVEDKAMISWAAKWLDDDKMMFASDYHDGHHAMVERIRDLLDEADAVVHYNGQRFDVPHIEQAISLEGLAPPSPFKQIDLIKVQRRHGAFLSNKLGNVADKYGIGHKVEHEGFALWLKVMADDPKAWAKMRRYNRQDVRLTEQLFHQLLPWIRNHWSYGAMTKAWVRDNL